MTITIFYSLSDVYFTLLILQNQVSVKHHPGSGMTFPLSVMRSVIPVIASWKDRLSLLTRVSDTFKELILDTHEFTDSGKQHDCTITYL